MNDDQVERITGANKTLILFMIEEVISFINQGHVSSALAVLDDITYELRSDSHDAKKNG